MFPTTDVEYSSSPISTISFIEYLQCDARPTFIIDTEITPDGGASKLRVVFGNKALQNHDNLFGLIETLLNNSAVDVHINDESDTDITKFLAWLQSSPVQESIWFDGLLWSSTYFHRRWIVVSGCHQPATEDAAGCENGCTSGRRKSMAIESRPIESAGQETLLRRGSDLPTTSVPRSPSRSPTVLAQAFGVKTSPHNLLVLGFHWAKTPIGPLETWPQVLRQMVPYLLNGLQPGAILWGAERTMIYNEGYVALIKALHPGALGSSARILFGNFWEDQMEPKWRSVELHGAARYENTQFYLDRSGFLEETYFTYSLTPLWDANGQCCGVDNRSFEVTRQVVVEERMLSLLRISESAASVTSLDDFWQGLVKAMAANASDFPLFALYSLQDSDLLPEVHSDESNAMVNRERWILRGSTGFAQNKSAIPDTLMTDADVGFARAFKTVLRDFGPLVFSEGDSVLKSNLLQGCDTPELKLKCHQVVVCPLHSSSRNIMGFLALGINPSRPYDEEYRTFVRLLSRQIETSISPILSLVNEKIRSRMNAQKSEYEQQLLTTRLEEQTLEARRSELRFLRFAEQAPLGVFVLGADGGVRFANEAWYKLIGIDQAYEGTHGWLFNIHPDDRQRVDEEWQRLVDGHTQTGFEWRALKKIPGREDEVIYLRSSSFPELSTDGTMKSVTGILMDLSLERAQQQAQGERLKDALEARQSQEYFMDMVSHEIRNPLHAILQLADETTSLLEDMKLDASLRTGEAPKIPGCLENIHTIMYCGHHQKQILDDVLTLSKLNSDMLTLSLTDASPSSVVSKVLKFFDSDIRLSSIETSLNLMGLASGSQYPNVLMDSGRVLQILINLVGNSIKFMKERSTRKLTLTVEMSSSKPVGEQLRYLPSGKKYADPTDAASLANKKVVYVQYSVQDTGPGLTSQEMDVLFERFKQVSPKTHTQYGGSGLGLFISRELAERHGGEIGLASVVDVGSNFAFYVKCPLSEQEPTEIGPTHAATTTSSRNGIILSPVNPVTVDESRKLRPQDSLSLRNNTTILIVEDNIVNQKILNRQLKKLGYQTQTANHGAEALSILKESTWWHVSTMKSFDISIILCDLEMPVMDGLTCVRKIREWQREKLLHPSIPIVALTGNARIEQINTAKEAGFDDVVSKPYAMQTVVALIEKMTLKE